MNNDVVFLNEQWTQASYSHYNIHQKQDEVVKRTSKYNRSIWTKASFNSIRHAQLESNNCIIAHIKDANIWTICIYLRPNEHSHNEQVLEKVNESIVDIITSNPTNTIIVFGDINREDSLTEVYIESVLDKVDLKPNHRSNRHETTIRNNLCAIFSNRKNRCSLYRRILYDV